MLCGLRFLAHRDAWQPLSSGSASSVESGGKQLDAWTPQATLRLLGGKRCVQHEVCWNTYLPETSSDGDKNMMQEFISEDDLKTFDGWLKHQRVDAAATAEELALWRPEGTSSPL